MFQVKLLQRLSELLVRYPSVQMDIRGYTGGEDSSQDHVMFDGYFDADGNQKRGNCLDLSLWRAGAAVTCLSENGDLGSGVIGELGELGEDKRKSKCWFCSRINRINRITPFCAGVSSDRLRPFGLGTDGNGKRINFDAGAEVQVCNNSN